MSTHIDKNPQKGFLALLASGFILACFGLLTRWLNQYMGYFSQVGMRMMVAIILVLPYLIYKKTSLKIKIVNLPLFTTFILSFPIYIIFFTISVNTTKVTNAFFYLFLSSMLTSYVVGSLYFKERFDPKKIFVAALLIMGLFFFINSSSLTEGWVGIITGLLGGLFWGISNATRKLYADKYDRSLVIILQMFFGSLLALSLSLLMGELQTSIWVPQTFLLVSIYGFSMVVVQILLFVGFRNFNLNLGSIVLASQLVFVQIFGMFLLNEFSTTYEMVGILLVSTAVVLSNVEAKSNQPKKISKSNN